MAAAGVAGVAITGLLAVGPPAEADPPLAIRWIDTVDGVPLAASESGRWVILNDPASDTFFRVDTETGVADELSIPFGFGVYHITENGTAVTNVSDTIWRERPGEFREWFDASLPDGWSPILVTAVDDTESKVLIRGLNTSIGKQRMFLFDLDTESFVPVAPDIDLGVTLLGEHADDAWFRGDGRIVVQEDMLFDQTAPTRFLVWTSNFSGAEIFGAPAEHEPTLGDWFIDRETQFVWFVTDDGGIVDGIGPGEPRWYRREIVLATDPPSTPIPDAVAPIEADDATSVVATPDGGLVMSIDAPTGGVDQPQLFTWDGSGPSLLQLTVGVGDTEPNGPIDRFFAPSIGDEITFSSFATNLRSDTTTAPPNGFLFRIDPSSATQPPPVTTTTLPSQRDPLEPVEPTEPPAQIAPLDTYCVPAVGARPSEFIGVNLTPVNATTNGNGALHSGTGDAPEIANVNFRAGSVDPNVAIARVNDDGRACFTNSRHGPVDLVADALFVTGDSRIRLPGEDGAVRLADTRLGLGGSTLVASETRCVAVPDATPLEWVGVNITPVNATARGNGALHSSDDPPPGTANVNFGIGTVDPNLAFAQVGADGEICFTNSRHGPVDVILDALLIGGRNVFGAPSDDGAVRLVDTRIGLGANTFAASETQCFEPVNVGVDQWVGLNITPVDAVTNGNGAVHASDDPAPATANVNFSAGSVDPNFALVNVGADAEVCFTNSRHGPVDVVIDQLGGSAAGTFRAPTDDGAYRLTDTRDARHAPA